MKSGGSYILEGVVSPVMLKCRIFAVFQHFQHTLVVMIDDHGDVLLVLFFYDSSSMPIRRTGLTC